MSITPSENWRWLAALCGYLAPLGLIVLLIATFKNKCDATSWLIALGTWFAWLMVIWLLSLRFGLPLDVPF